MTRLLSVAALVLLLVNPLTAQSLTSESAIIFDSGTGHVLWSDNAEEVRSIASLTKLMTAVVTLDSGIDLNQIVTVQRADVFRSNRTYLRTGDRLTIQEILYITLITSDNAGARVLARVVGGHEFIAMMNAKADELGLWSMTYADPAGLLAGNKSTAYDLASFLSWIGRETSIPEITQHSFFRTYTKNKRHRRISVGTTNRFVRDHDIPVVAGKTGFTSAAGYCLAVLTPMTPETTVAVVVLGSTSNRNRFGDVRQLLSWAPMWLPSPEEP